MSLEIAVVVGKVEPDHTDIRDENGTTIIRTVTRKDKDKDKDKDKQSSTHWPTAGNEEHETYMAMSDDAGTDIGTQAELQRYKPGTTKSGAKISP